MIANERVDKTLTKLKESPSGKELSFMKISRHFGIN